VKTPPNPKRWLRLCSGNSSKAIELLLN